MVERVRVGERRDGGRRESGREERKGKRGLKEDEQKQRRAEVRYWHMYDHACVCFRGGWGERGGGEFH